LLFNAADVVVVGRYVGKEALAAVGSTSSLIHLFVNFFIGLSVGSNVTIAQDIGAERFEYVHRSVHTAITLAITAGLALLVVGILFSRQMLLIMQSPADVINLSTFWEPPPICSMISVLLFCEHKATLVDLFIFSLQPV